VVFGQDNVDRFSVATDSDRKEILEDILGLHYLPEAQGKIKKINKDIVARIDRTIAQIDARKSVVCRLEDSIRDIELAIKSSRKKRYLRILACLDSILGVDDQIYDLDVQVMPHIDEREVERLETVWEKAVAEFNEVGSVTDSAVNQEIVRAEVKLEGLESDVETGKKKMKNLLKRAGSKCLACGQKITDQIAQDQAAKVNLEIDKKIKQKDWLLGKLGELFKARSEIEDEMKKSNMLARRVNTAGTELQGAKKQRELRNERIGSLRRLEGTRITHLRSLKQFSEDSHPNIKLRTKLQRELRMEELEIRWLEERLGDLEYEKEHYEFWIEGFSNAGIKSLMLDSVMPFLNERVAWYTSVLTGNEMEIEFINEKPLKSGAVRDKLEVSCSKEGGGDTYKAISGGEKKRADLCQSLALRDLVASRGNQALDFMFLDECFESLDGVGEDKVVDMLERLSEECRTIFVATHSSDLKELFPRRVTVVHDGKESRINA
jgi:DNA repair exonuclease SbcCD ATPase subunit